MIKDRLLSVGLICATMSVAVSGDAYAKDGGRTGAWNGVGVQATPQGDAQTWTMSVTFSEGGARVSYPSLGCAGVWIREGQYFSERIRSGDCIDGGLVRVSEQAGKLFVSWTVGGQSPDIAASAVLFTAAPIS